MNKTSRLRQFSGKGDFVVMGLIYAFLILLLLVILFPLLNILACSFSSPTVVSSGQVGIWPVEFSLMGYEAVFNNSLIANGFINSIIYMVLGTIINLIVTLMAAYPLSRGDLIGRGPLMFLFSFTMLFGGGMIPTYLVVRSLKMVDTIWAMVLPGALSVYNMIIARTFMQNSIPNELYESAQIYGWSYARMI